MVLIIYGYLLLAGILLIILFFIGFYFGYKNYIKADLDVVANTNQEDQHISDSIESNGLQRAITKVIQENKAPTLFQGLETIRKRQNGSSKTFGARASKRFVDKIECGLCYQTFLPTDEVVNCSKAHIFHMKCYEEYHEDEIDEETDGAAAMRNLCPTCQEPMLLTTNAQEPSPLNKRNNSLQHRD